MKANHTTRGEDILKTIRNAPEGGIVQALRDRRKKAAGKNRISAPISDFAAVLRKEAAAGLPLPGFYCRNTNPDARRIFWRRAAAVQTAYNNAPAGTSAIADAVWRKLQSFRPKLTGRELDDLLSSKFRSDVMGVLYGKIARVREEEHRAAEAADDARRAQRATRPKRARKGGAK